MFINIGVRLCNIETFYEMLGSDQGVSSSSTRRTKMKILILNWSTQMLLVSVQVFTFLSSWNIEMLHIKASILTVFRAKSIYEAEFSFLESHLEGKEPLVFVCGFFLIWFYDLLPTLGIPMVWETWMPWPERVLNPCVHCRGDSYWDFCCSGMFPIFLTVFSLKVWRTRELSAWMRRA